MQFACAICKIALHPGKWDISDETFEIQSANFTGGKGVEIIFAMDTSGSMFDEFGALCGYINEIKNGLERKGLNAVVRIYGISGPLDCAKNTVVNAVTNSGGVPISNHEEDWGPCY